MNNIDIFGKSNTEFIQALNERKSADMDEGVATITRPGFNGKIYFYELENILHIRINETFLKDAANINYHTSEDLIGFYFLVNMQGENDFHIFDQPIEHDIICIKQNDMVSYQFPNQAHVNLIYLGLPRNYYPPYFQRKDDLLKSLFETPDFCLFQMETPKVKSLCQKMMAIQKDDSNRYNLSIATAFELLACHRTARSA